MSEPSVKPVLATLPGRLRDWANASLNSSGGFTSRDLTADLWQAPFEGCAIVCLLDDPASAIADLADLGCASMLAAHWVGSVLAVASNHGHANLPRLLMRDAREDAASLCQRMCSALALSPGIATSLALPELRRPAGELAHELVEGFIRPLQSFAEGAHQVALVWPRASFRSGDRPHETAPERVELVGPARSLVYGPYLALPAGWWEAQLRLYFSEEACRRTFTVDMVAEDNIGTIRLKPTFAGNFRTRMMFHNPRAECPLALRIVLEHGAIEGSIGLEAVVLRHSRSEAEQS